MDRRKAITLALTGAPLLSVAAFANQGPTADDVRALARRFDADEQDLVAAILFTVSGAMSSPDDALPRLQKLMADFSRDEMCRLTGEHCKT